MLRVLAVSGNVVASLDAEAVRRMASGQNFGKQLKMHLESLIGTPHYRQRLFLQDQEVNNASWDLTKPVDLQLVQLPTRQGQAQGLVKAARRGNVATIEKFLEDLQDPDEEWSYEDGDFFFQVYLAETPLLVAARNGNLQVVELLLTAKADVNHCDSQERRSPLLVAAGFGHAAVVRRLIQADAKVDQVDRYGRTPLWVAVAGRCLKVVQILVDAGANLDQGADASDDVSDVESEDGITPMSVAAESGHLRILQCLLKAGADKNKADNLGRSPLWFAAATDHKSCVLALLKAGANKDQMNRDGKTPLLVATACASPAVVRCLVQHGADVEMPDNFGRTPAEELEMKGSMLLAEEKRQMRRALKGAVQKLHGARLQKPDSI
ncbi:unnamed protein product [Effrenium voratum]|nr:unnamed protein product [Effrenium voratum]